MTQIPNFDNGSVRRRDRLLGCERAAELLRDGEYGFLSMVEELKLLDGVPLEEAVAWATVNGAQALGLDGGIGSIEAGKRPGLVLLENLSYDSAGAHLTPESRSRRLV